MSFLYFNQGCQQLSKERVFFHSLAFSGPRAQVFFRNYRSLYLSKGILKMTRWRDSPTCSNVIGHFRVHLSLRFKARLSATSLLWKSVFIHIEIGINYHNTNFALRLALKERLRETRKWPTAARVGLSSEGKIENSWGLRYILWDLHNVHDAFFQVIFEATEANGKNGGASLTKKN